MPSVTVRPGRHFTNQAAKLLFTFDGGTIEIENYIVLA